MGTKRKRKLMEKAVPTIFSFSIPPKQRKLSAKRSERYEKSETVRKLIMDNEQENIAVAEGNEHDFSFPALVTTEPLSRLEIKTKECSVQTQNTAPKTKSVKIQCTEPIPCEKCECNQPLIKVSKRTPFNTRSKCCNTDLSFSPFADVTFSIVCDSDGLNPSTPSKDPFWDEDVETPKKTHKSDLKDKTFVPDSDGEEELSETGSCTMSSVIEQSDPISEPKLLVFWSCLVTLFTSCRECFQDCVIEKVTFRGTFVSIKTRCTNNHELEWNSQPELKKGNAGNILLSAAILYSGNTFQRITELLKMINVIHFSGSKFYEIQKHYLFPALNSTYKFFRQNLFDSNIASPINHYSGDGRCDSPGYSAKYGTYSMMNTASNKVIDFFVVHVAQAGNSSLMEKTGLKILLEKFSKLRIKITSLTTDRHTQIRAMMRDQYPNIMHQFDIWHFAKSLKKKLLKLGKKKDKKEINDWIKSIINHFWWCCATCETNVEVLKEKWFSILHHIRDVHSWKGNKHFKHCAHGRLQKRKWLKASSPAYKALKSVIEDKKTVDDLKYLVEFRHTGNLEVYHSVINKYCPKRLHFSFLGMIARTQLAVLDFNCGSSIQAQTLDGVLRYKQVFSRVTQSWVVKKITKEKERDYLYPLLQKTIQMKADFKGEALPNVGNIPSNIAPVEKPTKKHAIKNMQTKFTT